MIPAVPYAIRFPMAFAFLGSAFLIRVSGNLVSDILAAVARWMLPEREPSER